MEPASVSYPASDNRSSPRSGPPPIWHVIANAPKHTMRAEIQAAFNETALQLGMGTYAPIITVALARALEGPNLSADHSSTLTEGVQPFNLVPAGFSVQATESAAASADYDQLTSGGHTLQYSDILAIQGRQNLVLPNSTSGVGVHIRTAYIALATLLGQLHPFTLNMRALLEDWVGAEMELPSLLAPIPNGPAACVFWMSLRFHIFFHAAKNQPNLGPPAVPRMTELTEQLRLHMFERLAPPLPARYLPAAWKQPTTAKGPKTTGEGREGLGRNSTRIQNPHPNPAFRTYDKAGKLGMGVLKHPAPKTGTGHSMCLSYHMRNACNSDCPRAKDHQTHTAAEDNLILAWAKIALTAA